MDFTAYVQLCFFQFIESINWVDSDSFSQKIHYFKKPCQPFWLVESHQLISLVGSDIFAAFLRLVA